MRRKELEQLVFHVGQIERTPAERGLVGLDVEHQGTVLEQFGASAFAGPPEQVLETRLELTRMERRQAEIVVKVVAQIEVAELCSADQQQERFERAVGLADGASDVRSGC